MMMNTVTMARKIRFIKYRSILCHPQVKCFKHITPDFSGFSCTQQFVPNKSLIFYLEKFEPVQKFFSLKLYHNLSKNMMIFLHLLLYHMQAASHFQTLQVNILCYVNYRRSDPAGFLIAKILHLTKKACPSGRLFWSFYQLIFNVCIPEQQIIGWGHIITHHIMFHQHGVGFIVKRKHRIF